jgi:Right handed beta helix region
MRHHMTWLALATTLLCHAQVHAKDWYVANTNLLASDKNTGSAWLPFRTLAKLQTLGKLASGDTINLACGDVWRETLTLNSANSAGDLTIRSWPLDCGKTNKPTINAGILLSGIAWQAINGKPYFSYKLNATEAALITGDITFIRNPSNDVKAYFKARYPDPAASSNNYAIASGTDTTGATYDTASATYLNGQLKLAAQDMQAIGSNDIVGADLHMRNELWYVSSSKVAGYTPGSITVKNLPGALAANDGYVLENKLWMLNQAGEWYFDQSTKTLYMANVDGISVKPPTQLELLVRANALAISDIANIKITGISATSTVRQAIDIRNSASPTVDNVLTQYGAMGEGGGCGDNAAIYIGPTLNINDNCKPFAEAKGSHNASITNNIVQKSGYAGMQIVSDSANIYRNKIDNTGTISRTRNVQYALAVATPGGTITENTVTNSAYMGIVFSNKTKSIGGKDAGETISGNTVSKFCLFYADCGGIYTYNGDGPNDKPTPLTQGPSKVSNNDVFDSVGDYQGSRRPDRDMTVGVYLDAFTSNVTVDKNVLYRVGTGILMNGGGYNTIDRNVIHAATGQGLRANDGSGGGGFSKNNTVSNNVFHTYRRYVIPADAAAGTLPTFQAGVAQSWHHLTDPALLFTTQANVVKNNLAVDAGGKPAQWRLTQSKSYPESIDVSLGKWAQYAATDGIAAPFRPKLTNVLGTNLVTNGDFSAGLAPWSPDARDLGTTTVSDPGIANGCVGPCVRFVQQTGQPLQSNKFQLDAGAGSLYYFEYEALGKPGSKSAAHVFDASSHDNGYQSDADSSHDLGSPNDGLEVRWTERFFTPGRTDSNSRIAVYTNAGQPTYIDQVQVFKVSGAVTPGNLYDPSRYTALLYNNGAAGSSIAYQCPFTSGCAGAVNHQGAPLSFPLTVGAGGRVLVFLKPTEWAR